MDERLQNGLIIGGVLISGFVGYCIGKSIVFCLDKIYFNKTKVHPINVVDNTIVTINPYLVQSKQNEYK